MHCFRRLYGFKSLSSYFHTRFSHLQIAHPCLATMPAVQDLEALFKEEKFIDNYKIGEKVTGLFAKDLLDQTQLVTDANANPAKPLVVLDNACGTGIVSSLLQKELGEQVKHNLALTCGDISGGMLEYTQRRMKNEAWVNAKTEIVDAQDSKLPTAHFTHSITAFAFMTLPKSLAALDDTCRILQPGGMLACSTWLEPGWVPVVKKAIEIMPGNLPWPNSDEFLNSMGNGQWYSATWVESQLSHRDLEDVNVNVVTRTVMLSVVEMVEMVMVMFPMVAKYFWTEEQRKDNEEKVRPALQKYLVDTYKAGEVPLTWTAILATARKPLSVPEPASTQENRCCSCHGST